MEKTIEETINNNTNKEAAMKFIEEFQKNGKYECEYDESRDLLIFADSSIPTFRAAIKIDSLMQDGTIAVTYNCGNHKINETSNIDLPSVKIIGEEYKSNTQESYLYQIINDNPETLAVVGGKTDNGLEMKTFIDNLSEILLSTTGTSIDSIEPFGFSDGGQGATKILLNKLTENPDAPVKILYLDSNVGYMFDNVNEDNLYPGQITALFFCDSNGEYENYKTIDELQRLKSNIIFAKTEYIHGENDLAKNMINNNAECLIIGHPERFNYECTYEFHKYYDNGKYKSTTIDAYTLATLLSNGPVDEELFKNENSDFDPDETICCNSIILDEYVDRVLLKAKTFPQKPGSFDSTTKIPSDESGILTSYIETSNRLVNIITQNLQEIKKIGKSYDLLDEELKNMLNECASDNLKNISTEESI